MIRWRISAFIYRSSAGLVRTDQTPIPTPNPNTDPSIPHATQHPDKRGEGFATDSFLLGEIRVARRPNKEREWTIGSRGNCHLRRFDDFLFAPVQRVRRESRYKPPAKVPISRIFSWVVGQFGAFRCMSGALGGGSLTSFR